MPGVVGLILEVEVGWDGVVLAVGEEVEFYGADGLWGSQVDGVPACVVGVIGGGRPAVGDLGEEPEAAVDSFGGGGG